MSTSRVFRLEVRLDGAAFEAPAFGGRGEWSEVARILRDVAGQLDGSTCSGFSLILRDYNGNSCGGAWVSVEPVDRLAFKRSARAGRRFTSDG